MIASQVKENASQVAELKALLKAMSSPQSSEQLLRYTRVRQYS